MKLDSEDFEGVATLQEAIELYLESFAQQFSGLDTLKKKHRILHRFLKHLQQYGHPVRVDDLLTTDGQTFMDSLQNLYTGKDINQTTRRRYRSVLRTFSRFLFQSGLLEGDVFFWVT